MTILGEAGGANIAFLVFHQVLQRPHTFPRHCGEFVGITEGVDRTVEEVGVLTLCYRPLGCKLGITENNPCLLCCDDS